MSENCFQNPFGSYFLSRYPENHDKSLRAWDAADEYLLRRLSQLQWKKGWRVLIFNDAFGALTTALHEYNPVTCGDSFLSLQAIKKNAARNQLPEEFFEFRNSLQAPDDKVSVVLLKVPKSLDYLKYFIHRMAHCLQPNSKILIAGMQKNLPKTLWDYLQTGGEFIFKVNTLPAVKKAKLIEVDVGAHLDFDAFDKLTTSPYPTTFKLEDSGFKIFNHANVFSKRSLDIGARFLLENAPHFDFQQGQIMIDLGCGNGVLGLHFAHKYENCEVHFVDESYMAIESAKLTLKHNLQEKLISNQHCFFHVNHGLLGWEKASVDMVICNPPFHQNQTVGVHIAKEMFQQAHHALKVGGRFLVVANRHLPYFSLLKRRFKSLETLASNRKFNLYLATK